MVLHHAPAGSVRKADIENKFAMTNPTVTGLVQKLEAKNPVKRIPHTEDKRSKVLVLTDRAMEMKEELLALADNLEQIRQLNDLAARRGQTLAQMALSWILRDGIVTSVLTGASRPEQVPDNIKAAENTTFTPEELALINQICPKNYLPPQLYLVRPIRRKHK